VAENELVAEVREGAGKGAARKLRATGRIPGVCYGRTLPSVGISLDPRELERLIAASTAGVNTLFQLRIAGVGDLDGKPVMVRELQRNPVNGLLLHADLYAVDLEQTIHVSVPIHITGTPAGVKMGGILDQALVRLLTSGHYALGDTRTPVWIAGLSVTVSAAAAFLLMRLYGVVGIAMGSMLGAYVNASLNYHTLAGRTQGIVGKPELGATAIALLAAVVAAAAAWGLDRVTALDGIWMPALLNLGTFGLVYLSLAKLLGHPQISARRDS
jgi:ribosomal protein bL25 (Ctc-form)